MTVTSVPQTARTVIPGPQRRPAAHADGWAELIESVKDAGRYPTTAQAERVTRVVLSALGGHVTGDERVALAQALPAEAGRVIASQIPATRPRTAREFVDTVAARTEGATPATARWDAGSVLSVLPTLVGEALIDRVLAQLPPGYALLFGRAELASRS
ncbi:DUF2267 domain-containing protein [Streptomyces sp. A012304]|uniref:DUF2267 domain-containing protein n=1 Tax=Streptomyces sp. A012304 TaxID=375446 RepID=UPI00222FE726|nr:DUF2267 domain-containing protein [Streptomyces sp. A012304]GKQ37721.1 hypothetical protein ALMP_42570 [Streptomyces sp. A012304]